MNIITCAGKPIRCDDNGTFSITVSENTVVKLSTVEVMAMALEAIRIMTESAKIPENLVERVKNDIKSEKNP